MKQGLISIITCPRCKSLLKLEISNKGEERIHKGKLSCKKCTSIFEIIDDIVCFKPISEREKKKKEIQNTQNLLLRQELKKEWIKHLTEQEFLTIKDEWNWMINNLNLKKSQFHLDWATGMARFLINILKVIKGEIIALEVDYPTCVGLKRFFKKIGGYSKVTIVCSDARNMPFLNNSIDSISSWGGLNEPNIRKAIDESKKVLKKGGVLAVSGEFYEDNSKSLKKAQKAGIEFAKENKTYQYFKRLSFRNISYKTFFKAKKLEHRDFLPCFGDYYTSYVISGRK